MWLFAVLMRPFCAFLTILSSTSVQPLFLSLSPHTPCCECEHHRSRGQSAGEQYDSRWALCSPLSRDSNTCQLPNKNLFQLGGENRLLCGYICSNRIYFPCKSVFFPNAAFMHQNASSCNFCSWWTYTDFVALDQALLWQQLRWWGSSVLHWVMHGVNSMAYCWDCAQAGDGHTLLKAIIRES